MEKNYMENQIKGIALILLGILSAILDISAAIGIFSIIGGVLGITGFVVVCWNGRWKGEE